MVLASSSSEDEAGFNKGGLGYDWPEGHEPWSETLGDLRGAEMGTDARVRLHTKNEKEVSLAGEGMEGLRKISDSLGWTWGLVFGFWFLVFGYNTVALWWAPFYRQRPGLEPQYSLLSSGQ